MPNRISIVATVKDGVSGSLDKIRDKVDLLGKGTASSFLAGKVGADLFERGVSDVIGILQGAVEIYRQQEVASGRLSASLKANATDYDGTTKAIDQATQAGIALGFTETDTTNAIATLVTATHSEAKALNVLTVARDLARFKGISLGEAATALTSIEAGRARGLAALGINVKDFATTEERLAAVEKVAGGQAASYADTDLGKLAVATAKVDEAQEKLGKGLSKLEAVVLPAVADAVDGLANEVDGLQTAFDNTASPSAKLRAEALALRTGLAANIPGVKQYADALDAEADALDGTAASTVNLAGRTDDWMVSQKEATVALGSLDEGAAFARGSLSSLADEEARVSQRSQELESDIHDLASTLIDELYGDTIRAGKEADLEGRIHDLSVELSSTTDKAKAIELKGQIAELRGELFQLHLEEAASKGPKAAIDFLNSIKTSSKEAKAEIQRLIDKYRALLSLPSSTVGPMIRISGTGGTIGGRAKGGAVRPGETVVVGEEGPEILEQGTAGGLVIPLNGFATSPLTRGRVPRGNSAFGRSGGAGFHGTDERANAIPAVIINELHIDASGHKDPDAVAAAVRGAVSDGMAYAFRDQSKRMVGARLVP